jgi:hypothetical protein
MKLLFLSLFFGIVAAVPPKIIGPVAGACSPRQRLDFDGVSVPSGDWKEPLHALAVRDASGALHSCISQALCPEHLHCDLKTRSCASPVDWISSLYLHCPNDDSCLAHCFVSFHVLLDVVFKELIVFLASVATIACISNLVKKEFFELPT